MPHSPSHHSPARAAVLVLALAGLVGCGSSGSATSSANATSTGTSATSTSSSSSESASTTTGSVSSTSSSTTSTGSSASAGGLPADHSVCALIPEAKASSLLGGSVKHATTPDTSNDMVTHIDRCNWTASGGGSLAYQVDRYANAAMVQAVVSHIPGNATPVAVEPGGKGFVINLGPKAMARAWVVVEPTLVLDLTATAASVAAATTLLHSMNTLLLADVH